MRKSIWIASFMILGLVPDTRISAQERPRAAEFVSPEARLEQVFSGGVNTEGPAVARDASVYFVDAPVSTTTPRLADRIWRSAHSVHHCRPQPVSHPSAQGWVPLTASW